MTYFSAEGICLYRIGDPFFIFISLLVFKNCLNMLKLLKYIERLESGSPQPKFLRFLIRGLPDTNAQELVIGQCWQRRSAIDVIVMFGFGEGLFIHKTEQKSI